MRTVLLRSIGVISIGAGLVIACSSSSGDNPGGGGTDDGGGVVDPGIDSSVDSGGGDAGEVPVACAVNTDCKSGVCNTDTKICAAPTCTDGVKNEDESDVDCGGACGKCDQQKTCNAGTDCKDGVCSGGKCAAPTNTDGVKNGNETGIDCGNTGNPKCDNGQGCKTRDDCTSAYCKNSVCTAVTPADGVQNGNETDVDCGGDGNAPCGDTKKCLVDTDCESSVCLDTGAGLTCQAPTAEDGKRNGDETDVDCGGSSGKTCATGLKCLAGADCTSGGCNYLKVCADHPSCTPHYGGDTCGLGGAGGQGAAQWESCCTTADVQITLSGATATEKAGVTHLGKYQVTAGRMRAFLESVNYDVRSFVQQARTDGKIPKIFTTTNAAQITHYLIDPDWDAYLPTSFAGNANADEIADCDQGFWDYTNKACCETAKPSVATGIACTTDADCSNAQCVSKKCVACPGGSTYNAGSTAGDERCHYWSGGACAGGHSGVYNGTYTAVRRHLGGTIFRANSQTSTGCFPGSPGTHAFRFPDGVYDGDNPANAAEYGQDVYDTKAMNCTPYLMAQAFCIWDGGRLASLNEWRTASYGTGGTTLALGSHVQPYGPTYTNPNGTVSTTDQNPGTDAYNPPWWTEIELDPKQQISGTFNGRRFPTATDASLRAGAYYSGNTPLFPDLGHTIEYANWRYSYEYPGLVSHDYIVFISPPGRTKGRGWKGHADLLGNVFEIESNLTYTNNVATLKGDGTPEASVFQSRTTWSGNGSWEVHDYGGGGGSYSLLNKYGKQGFRCAYK